MTAPVLSQTQQLWSALESTAGTAPTTGWKSRKFAPDGIGGLQANLTKVADDRVDGLMQRKKGDVVDLDIEPKITGLLCKDDIDDFGTGVVRAAEKFKLGGKRWFPTAVTSSQFTVDALGALPSGTLVYARGFANAANNGLFVVQAASTGTAVKVTGTVAETVSPTSSAILEVAGFQGAAGDLQLDASGNLTSTVYDFTTLGLTPGEDIGIGGATGGLLVFTNAVYRGPARVNAVVAHKITLERRAWVVGSATVDASTTVQILLGSYLRNVAITSADYLVPSWSFERSQVGSGAAGATQYIDATGNTVKMTEIDATLKQQIKMTTTFVGMYCGAPVDAGSRITGPSTAFPSVAFAPINTASDAKLCEIRDLSETLISADVNSWKLSINTNASGRKALGTVGNKDVLQGDVEVDAQIGLFLGPGGLQSAAFLNTTVQSTARFANGDGCIVFDCPEGTITLSDPKAAKNDAIRIDTKYTAHVSQKYGHSIGITKFPYWPY